MTAHTRLLSCFVPAGAVLEAGSKKNNNTTPTYLEEILLSRLDPRPPSSLTVVPARTLERKTEQRASAAAAPAGWRAEASEQV